MKQIVSRPLDFLSPSGISRLVLYTLVRLVYRIHSKGTKNFPATGGALLISNHISYVDAFLLQVASPRYLHFVASEHFLKKWWLGWAMRAMGVVPISSTRPKRALQAVIQKLKEGEVVCIFPEGTLTRTGNLQGFQKGFEVMARQAGVPVVPAAIDGIWGSVFSHSTVKLLQKRPLPYGRRIRVSFGAVLQGADIERRGAWQATLDLLHHSFSEREELTGHIGRAAIKALGGAPWRKQIIDINPERHALSRGALLALAITLARRWRRTMPEKRVGVILPPGLGSTVANLAIALLDKSAVNLNFNLGGESVELCCRQAELETILSSEAMRKRFERAPLPENTIDLLQEIRTCGKRERFLWFLAVWLLPPSMLNRLLGIPKHGDRNEAAVLFTHCSADKARGVILTHRNILANIIQISETAILRPADTLVGNPDVFHSFGFTMALWYPLLKPAPMVTLPLPVRTQATVRAIRNEKANILIATPPFLRACLEEASPEDLRPLRLIFAGTEKLPADLGKSLQETFNVPVMEGYGLAETTGVAALSIPDPDGRDRDTEKAKKGL
ncbi:MAG: AMP-binding protein [Opitutales bacterium]